MRNTTSENKRLKVKIKNKHYCSDQSTEGARPLIRKEKKNNYKLKLKGIQKLSKFSLLGLEERW